MRVRIASSLGAKLNFTGGFYEPYSEYGVHFVKDNDRNRVKFADLLNSSMYKVEFIPDEEALIFKTSVYDDPEALTIEQFEEELNANWDVYDPNFAKEFDYYKDVIYWLMKGMNMHLITSEDINTPRVKATLKI